MKIIHLLFVMIIASISIFSFANDQAMLKVTGNIIKTNQSDKKSYVFSFNELSNLPNTVVRTKTKWSATSDFAGPTISGILTAVGAGVDAKKVELRCHNNFVVTIPISDFKKWDVILAYSQNNKRLTLATKGPLWVVYPIDQYKAELNNNLTREKLAWGVKEMVVY